jgi:hypothetical protein
MTNTKVATAIARNGLARRYRVLITGWLIVPFFVWSCSLCFAFFYSDRLLVVLFNIFIPAALLLTAWLHSVAFAACMRYRTSLRWYILTPQFQALYIVLTIPLIIPIWCCLPVEVQLSVFSWIGLLILYGVISVAVRRIARAHIEAESQAYGDLWSKLAQVSLWDILLLRIPYDPA